VLTTFFISFTSAPIGKEIWPLKIFSQTFQLNFFEAPRKRLGCKRGHRYIENKRIQSLISKQQTWIFIEALAAWHSGHRVRIPNR
jgi:hypothetical protein